MNTLKELVNKVYLDLQSSEWINEYPELSEKRNIADGLEAIALNMIQDFVPEEDMENFADECDTAYSESTFKKYIKDYTEFLNRVEHEFYNGLLMWLTDEE